MGRDDCHPPPRCPERPTPPPPGEIGRPGDAPDYSGFVIVRLSPSVPPGKHRDLRDLAKRQSLEGLAAVLEEEGIGSTAPVVRSLSPDRLRELEERAGRAQARPLHSLTSYWRLDLRHRPDEAERVVERLNALNEVDLAYRELAVTDPQVNAADDPYADNQGYLDPAPDGIDARWAWTQPNGVGTGVGVVDLEQGWFLSHEDLATKSPDLIYGDNRDGVGSYKGNHGTAVLGEITGDDNTVGVVGIAPHVAYARATSHYDAATNTALHVADALVAALPEMAAGDVVLLEVQRSYLPTETDDADFDAVRLAVALGIVVIEAAGNGGNDLDAYTNPMGERIFDRSHADFRDSGAIMVGAASSDADHNRLSFSNFGSRIDCYGWGEDVATCGYGDLDGGGGDDDKTYTATFGGTSSASPIVTGAALILQGMHEATAGTRLSPGQMHTLLSDPTTGTPQGTTVAGDIGVMPDLRATIEDVLGLVPDVYLRDNLGDDGAIPSAGSISASPDLFALTSAVADPQGAFGEGSGTEHTHPGGAVEAGQDNFVYARVRNRGSTDAAGVTTTVFWSEVSTLVTPDMWHLIGTTAPVDVPQGDTLVVADPVTWPTAEIPATGHYCFVGLADHPQDPAPPQPPSTADFDWDAFRDFIRNRNNVTWRNFNVVDDLPDPGGDPVVLPFLIAGAPDRAREFDLEVIRRLPAGAELWLEIGLAVVGQISERAQWKGEVDRKRARVRLQLPAVPRLPLCGIRLGKGARHEARMLVRGGRNIDFRGNEVAVRQVFDKQEMGRVSWRFAASGKQR